MDLNFKELLNELDQIWDTYSIDCNGIKHLIPVNDYDLDTDKINEWISLQEPYYQKVSKILFDNFVEHVSYENFLKKCLESVIKLEQSIKNKIKILHNNQKVLLLLNLAAPKYHKSENWVFSVMYSGGGPLFESSTRKGCFKNILKKLNKLYHNKIEIKILYQDKIEETFNEILNDPTDYLILDCKFDDCSYSGSQLSQNIIKQSNIIFKLLKNNDKYTIKNPDINDDNGIFYFDYKKPGLLSRPAPYLGDLYYKYSWFFKKPIIDSYSINNHLYFLRKLKYPPAAGGLKYLGKSLVSLYKNNYKTIKTNITLSERLEILNNNISARENLKLHLTKFKNIYDPNDLDNNLMDLYKQIQGINYTICICIPYITNTSLEKLDQLMKDNTFYHLEKLNVVTPLNIEAHIDIFNTEAQEDERDNESLCVTDISNIFYGNINQQSLLCDQYQLSKENTRKQTNNLCKYLHNITKYKQIINKTSFIYFDHKMATFSSSFPMTLLLGNIWFPNQGLPFFYGPLIKNPASITYTNQQIKNLLSTFGDDKQTNYYFFDRYIIPPYKLKNIEEIRNYLKYYDKCNTLSYNICNCLPKCKKYRDTCIKKTDIDYIRDYIRHQSTIM